MQRTQLAAIAAASLVTLTAEAHISVPSGPATANKSQKITFAISHGCSSTDDTVKVKIEIPAGVTSPRALFSDFGKPKLNRDPNNSDAATNVQSIEWTKSAADELDTDDGFYEITLRAKVPNTPFTRIQFNILQTCKSGASHNWNAAPGTSGDPAPLVTVVPARVPGWNKYTISSTISKDDLPAFFGDAQIMWRGNEAFSTNSNTKTLIEGTTGVTFLSTDLVADDEIWVKY